MPPKKRNRPANFNAHSMRAKCPRCGHLFLPLITAGGIELLDVETLNALRNDESVIRWGLSRLERYQKLSDELIVPNLDQDISYFYDPATRRLRTRFQIYPEALQATVKFAHELDRTHTELLKRIEAQRQR